MSMVCYVDEAGCTGVLPTATSPIQPVLVIIGLAIDESRVRNMTFDFLNLKRRYFPGKTPTGGRLLDWQLVEIKGSELRKRVAEGGASRKRHALGFLGKTIELVENHRGVFFGRVWIKGIGTAIDGTAIYTFSMQDICKSFQHCLQSQSKHGIVIADSRTKAQNSGVSHSLFTQKFQVAGDTFPNLREMVVFGHSDNHAGLQVVDTIASGIVCPMAIHAYCTGHVNNLHIRPGYSRLRDRFCTRLRNLQYRYQIAGRYRGGLTVSDQIAQRPGGELFRPATP
jgi:hypothetical protein